MELVKLLGGVLTGNLEEDFLSTWVFSNKRSNVKHLVVNNDPQIVFLVVLSDFLASKGLAHGLWLIFCRPAKTSASKVRHVESNRNFDLVHILQTSKGLRQYSREKEIRKQNQKSFSVASFWRLFITACPAWLFAQTRGNVWHLY
jgi:hypothetical protein